MPQDASPQASLYYISEESWKGFTEWALKPIPLTIGPTCFNLSVATRVVSAGKWLGNEVMNLVLTFSEFIFLTLLICYIT